MSEARAAKLIIEVVAGLVPGEQPDSEYTRRWAITSDEWEAAKDRSALLAERNGAAMGYAAFLMLQPDRLNWVRTDWIWL